jgi:hypothetical protein
MQAMADKLAQAVADVQTSLNVLLQTYNSATVNPISGTYKADHTGLDGMLDVVKVNVSNGTVTITNASTGATIFTSPTSNIKGGTITTVNIPGASSTAIPTITSASNATFTIGTAGSFTVTATGNPQPTLSVTGTLPSGVTFNSTTGVLSGTPAAGTSGAYNLTFKASNGVLPDVSQSFTLSVISSTQMTAPVITSTSNTSFMTEISGSFSVTTTGNPNPTLSYTGTLPAGVTFDTATGILSGTPSANNAAGAYPIIFTAKNGISPDATQNFALNVMVSPIKSTGYMTINRAYHTATLLPNGKTLIAGGYYQQGDKAYETNEAELYDPSTGKFTSTGNMASARQLHTATLLPNGKVLIVGGYNLLAYNTSTIITQAEIYDPTTGTFTTTGYTNDYHSNHTATLLANGKVLIAGGLDGYYDPTTSAELYDPSTGTFTTTGGLNGRRSNHTATLLPNGKVLVAGGYSVNSSTIIATASSELYDPITGKFTTTGNLITARGEFTSTLLGNGKVLVAGGFVNNTPLGGAFPDVAAELYDPLSGTFTVTSKMTYSRHAHTATLLNNGNVLIMGGQELSKSVRVVLLFDPTNGTFQVAGTLPSFMGNEGATSTLLQNGSVLFTGGKYEPMYTAGKAIIYQQQ